MKKMTACMMTPDQVIFEAQVNRIRFYGGWDGYFTVLPRHAPMVVALEACELQIEDASGKMFYIAVDSGIVEVAANRVNILSQVAVVAEERHAATAKMEAEHHARQKQNVKDREQGIKSEMELYRLLRQANESQVR